MRTAGRINESRGVEGKNEERRKRSEEEKRRREKNKREEKDTEMERLK